MPSLPDSDKVVRLDEGRTRRFLRDLAHKPFIAVVLDQEADRAIIYTKGIELTPEALRTIKATLDTTETGEQ